jgi:hypothetical protein
MIIKALSNAYPDKGKSMWGLFFKQILHVYCQIKAGRTKTVTIPLSNR